MVPSDVHRAMHYCTLNVPENVHLNGKTVDESFTCYIYT